MKAWFFKVSVVILGMGVVSCSSSKESVSSASSPSVESNSSPHFVVVSSGGPHTATGSSYDVNGNPAFESSSGLETRYKYDTNLRLIEQEVRPQGQSTPGTKFRSVYNAEGVKIASFLPDGTIDTFHPSTRMRKKPGSVLAMISYEGGEIDETTPSRFNKLIKDHLGSVVAVANTLGFEEVKDVLPYGQDFYRSTTPHTSYGFNGNKEEGISSLNKPLLDYNARYYAPGRGRFTGVDTVVPDPGSVTGYNRYTYTSNNPVNRIDPTGHADEKSPAEHFSEWIGFSQWIKKKHDPKSTSGFLKAVLGIDAMRALHEKAPEELTWRDFASAGLAYAGAFSAGVGATSGLGRPVRSLAASQDPLQHVPVAYSPFSEEVFAPSMTVLASTRIMGKAELQTLLSTGEIAPWNTLTSPNSMGGWIAGHIGGKTNSPLKSISIGMKPEVAERLARRVQSDTGGAYRVTFRPGIEGYDIAHRELVAVAPGQRIGFVGEGEFLTPHPLRIGNVMRIEEYHPGRRWRQPGEWREFLPDRYQSYFVWR